MKKSRKLTPAERSALQADKIRDAELGSTAEERKKAAEAYILRETRAIYRKYRGQIAKAVKSGLHEVEVDKVCLHRSLREGVQSHRRKLTLPEPSKPCQIAREMLIKDGYAIRSDAYNEYHQLEDGGRAVEVWGHSIISW